MKTIACFLCLLTALHAAEIAELKGLNGAVYHHVKITGISGDKVAIIFEGGAANVPAGLFDLETLARAQMEIDGKAEAAKQVLDPEAGKTPPPKKLPPLDAPAAKRVKKLRATPSHPEALLAGYKSLFGAPRKARVTVFIKQFNGTRSDVIEIDVPEADTYQHWAFLVKSMTLDNLPGTLAALEKSVAEKRAELEKILSVSGPANGGYSGQQSAIEQAKQTRAWMDQYLTPAFFAQLHSLLPPR